MLGRILVAGGIAFVRYARLLRGVHQPPTFATGPFPQSTFGVKHPSQPSLPIYPAYVQMAHHTTTYGLRGTVPTHVRKYVIGLIVVCTDPPGFNGTACQY